METIKDIISSLSGMGISEENLKLFALIYASQILERQKIEEEMRKQENRIKEWFLSMKGNGFL